MKRYFVAASIIAVAISTLAHAQEVGSQVAAPVAGIADIIVTAQKRPEATQRAPLAITSLSGDVLKAAHVDGPADLMRVVPNLTAQAGGGSGDPAGGQTVFTIRGLGASATGPQGSAGVAPHFDGVYRQDGISSAEFFDLERVEVAPGPQGTLYGRSAAAGAVNVIPAKPVLGHFHGAASFQFGNYGSFVEEGMVNVPVGEKVAVRVAMQKQDHDGYYSNGYDALNTLSGRVQLLAKPNDRLTVRLAANYAQMRGVGSGNIVSGGPALSLLTALLPQAADPDLRKRNINNYCVVSGFLRSNCSQNAKINKFSALAELSYAFEGATLTLLPSYSQSHSTTVYSNAPVPLSYYNQSPRNNDQTNFEARLSDNGKGKFKWIVGGNYYHNSVRTSVDQFINTINAPGAPPLLAPFYTVTAVNAFQQQNSVQTSYALFAQGTYPVLDGVRLTLGARYNWDKSSASELLGNVSTQFFQVNGSGAPLFSVPGLPVSTPLLVGSQSFRAFTYRAALDVDVGPRSIAYASVSSGYKPGGLNDGGPKSTTPSSNANYDLAPDQFFGPERVTHFEIGSKNRFMSNRLQVNLAAYYDDYKDYQNGATQVVNPLQYGALGFVVSNAGKARVYGTEAAITWQPTSSDTFQISGNYLHATFITYLAPAILAPGGVRAPAQNFSGYDLPTAPEFSANVSYRHTFDLGSHGKIDASAFSYLTTSYWAYFAQTPGTYQKGFTNTGLDVRWTSNNGRLSAAAFVKNLENHNIILSGIYTAGYSTVNLAPPRTFGGSISYKF